MNETGDAASRLEGKAALVTGASSGLGRATAIALARAGADVALVARSQRELDSARKEISKTGRRALTLPVDLASEDETVAAVERTVEDLGRIDVLVNAAGTYRPSCFSLTSAATASAARLTITSGNKPTSATSRSASVAATRLRASA